jgi:signal peptidase I
LLRYPFYLVWLVLVPGALALGAVRLLTPPPTLSQVDPLRGFVGEQQVPATILFFTLFAMFLWRYRYALPLASTMGVLGRTDVRAEKRARFEAAGQLLEEARRVMQANEREIERALSRQEREALRGALEALHAEMNGERFVEERFEAAVGRADQLVGEHLGRWRKGEVREYAESIGVAVAVALLLRVFVVEAFKIPSGSMIPTLMIGDHIFVAKFAYGPLLPYSTRRLYEDLPPDRGDVMVFKFPENVEQDFIKRVVALPGDTLEVMDGRPVLNGFLVPHCFVGKLDMPHGARGFLYLEHLAGKSYLTMYDQRPSAAACETDHDCTGARVCRGGICGLMQGPYRAAPNEVWVLGDNRNNSHDSRSWKGGLGGGVPLENIKGRAMFVWMSWDPTGGVAWDRLTFNVMGPPRLPPGVPAGLRMGLQRCTRERPPLAMTTPPAPAR